MNNIKDRIREMKILRNYIKRYINSLTYYSREKAQSLIQDIETELNWFELQKKMKETRDKQISLF